MSNLSVLRERPFLLLFSARSLSVLGDAVAPVGLAFAVLEMPGGSGTALGLVLAVRTIARIPFLLYGGILADRIPRHRVMILSDLAAGTAQAVIAALVLTRTGNTLNLAVLSLFGGAASALLHPAARAVTSELVPKDKIQSANALVQLAQNTGNIGGAALAGVIVVLVGPGWALALDAATFFVSAALLTGIRTRLARLPVVAGGVMSQLKGGWHAFTARRWVWVTVSQLALVNVCIAGGFLVLGPVVAKSDLGGASAWAILATAQAVGLTAGSVLALRVRPRWPIRAATLFVLGIAPPFVGLAFPAPVAIIAAAMAVAGVCICLADVIFQTALQKHLPPDVLSRVMSYDSMGSFVFLPVGLAVITPIASVVGLRATFLGLAGLIVLSTLVTLAAADVGRIRDVAGPPAAPDPAPLDQPAAGTVRP